MLFELCIELHESITKGGFVIPLNIFDLSSCFARIVLKYCSYIKKHLK